MLMPVFPPVTFAKRGAIMKRYACLLATLMSVLLRIGTVHADVINLNVVTIATGVDVGALRMGCSMTSRRSIWAPSTTTDGPVFARPSNLTCLDFNQDPQLTPLC